MIRPLNALPADERATAPFDGASLRIALYHGLPVGGAKRVAFEHAKGLARQHELAFFSLGETDEHQLAVRFLTRMVVARPFQRGRLFTSPFGRLNSVVRILDLLRLRAATKEVARQIDAGGFDVVLVHPCQYAHVPWLLQFIETPSVFYCHEHNRLIHERAPARPYTPSAAWRQPLDAMDPFKGAYQRLLRRIEQRGLAAADQVLVNSHYVRREVQRLYGIQAEVCSPAVAVDGFRPLALERESFVLSVGGLLPQKGFDFIVEGLGRVPQTIRPRLVLAYATAIAEERAYLEALAHHRGVQVDFVHRVPDGELVQLYNRALATVYTPVREPFGLVPLESMACGTPVVGIAEGGVPETVVDGVTGRLVHRDPEDLAMAITWLVQHRRAAEEMGKAGRAHVERAWTWEYSLDKLTAHLQAVARAGRVRRKGTEGAGTHGEPLSRAGQWKS